MIFLRNLVVVSLPFLPLVDAANGNNDDNQSSRALTSSIDKKQKKKKATTKAVEKLQKKGSKNLTLKKEKNDSMRAKSTLRVMTYNIWGGGGNEGKPIDETVTVFRAAGADIIGVQETRLEGSVCTSEYCPPEGDSVVEAIASELGFYFYEQTATNVALWANAVISRFPILYSTSNDLGVAIDVGNGNTVFAYNVHFTDFPYQPYQLLDIEYGDAPYLDSEEEAIEAADDARGPALTLLYADLKEAGDDDVAFIFGDFNEPSFRDWTKDAVKAGQQPIKVEYPTTKNLETLGFVDALREVYPDEVAKPAFTWTPTTDVDDPEDHHDRIDFVFARGKNIRVLDAAVVGEKSPEADIVVTPYPSDHRAVVATVEYY
jgi:exodeoxyribonuclease-3